MRGIPRYVQILMLFCVGSAIFVILPLLRDEGLDKRGSTKQMEHQRTPISIYWKTLKKRNFSDKQISKMSLLGQWLLSPEGSPLPQIQTDKKDPYVILVWEHGAFLKRRHIRRFTNNEFSPWDNCTVKNCVLSYRKTDLDKADAVIFHLHLTKSKSELPSRIRSNQKWIFLTDESPMHTFLYGNQKLTDYNGLFNWSMSYRMDSDVPVPYGRTIARSFANSTDPVFTLDFVKKYKTKLVAIMGSNCGGNNGRWEYVKELKSLLGDNLHIYGRCLNGNTTACPGHFDKDCSALNAYKFYLAFENSNCKEYLTEKVFWNGYHKLAVPIIMGASRKDCNRLLPPRSFLHVSDFANPAALANYITYLSRYDDKYIEYHEWRNYYKVINDHGYFGSASRHYCRVCEALHYNYPVDKIYKNIGSFWSKEGDCFS